MTCVLYVEDDSQSRTVFEMLMTMRMKIADVIILEDSADFENKTKAIKPDIVFLDIHVKPHNGFDMLKMLRQIPHYQRTPIIALTASVMNEQVQQLRDAGFDGVFSKPLNLSTFPDLFRRALDGEQVWRVID